MCVCVCVCVLYCSDLYGAVGFPRCLTRTVIVGTDVSLIEQILRVLTYFIRCSELAENTEVFPLLTADIDDTVTLKSPSDSTTSVSCLPADVTLSPNSPVSSSIDTVAAVSREKPQFSNSSLARGIRVRFKNGDNNCSIGTPMSSEQNCTSAVGFSSNSSVVTTASDQSVSVKTDSDFVVKPHLLFRSDVSDVLHGLTCSGCNIHQPCQECLGDVVRCYGLPDLSQSNDCVEVVSVCKSAVCNAPVLSDTAQCRHSLEPGCDENLPTDSKLCQLSPTEANENVRVERIIHVGREQVADPLQKFRRVPLGKPATTSLGFDHTQVFERSPSKSPQRPHYQRGNSMFDEYFDGSSSCPVIDLCDNSLPLTGGADDMSTFDEIMNEPCPDVSHINVGKLSPASSSSDTVTDPVSENPVCCSPSAAAVSLSSFLPDVVAPVAAVVATVPSSSPLTFDNVFVEQHFAVAAGEEHLGDIPDGPSKQMISSAIKLAHDVCSDRTSQTSPDDIADMPACDYFSQSGLGPSRGRQRHHSGQSNTSVHCR